MELLSPAGNPELALAAFDGGADAVYCGLGKFNARERAENFTPESLGKLIRFAGEHRKKVYVTFNTLIFENELPAMFEHLCMLARLHPDALIVQDPGVAAANMLCPEKQQSIRLPLFLYLLLTIFPKTGDEKQKR